MKRSLLFRNHSFSSMDIPSIPSSFSVEMFTRMQTESTSFRPAARCPLPVGSLATLLHSTLPSLVEIHPRHPSLSPPHSLLCLSQTFSPSLSKQLHYLGGGLIGFRDLGEIQLVGGQDPKGFPKLARLLPILCGRLGPWVGVTPSDPLQAHSSGESWAGRQVRGHPCPRAQDTGAVCGL